VIIPFLVSLFHWVWCLIWFITPVSPKSLERRSVCLIEGGRLTIQPYQVGIIENAKTIMRRIRALYYRSGLQPAV